MAIAPISVGDTNARAKMNEVIAKANLVDDKASVAQVSAETAARQVAIAQEAAARGAGLSAEAAARQAGLTAEAAARRADILALPLPMPVQRRPGDAPLEFGRSLADGEAAGIAPLPDWLLRYDEAGKVARLTGDDIVAPRHLFALEPGRRYLVTFAVQRRVNSPDPDNDAIRCAFAWYGQGKGRLLATPQTIAQDLLGLTTGSGRQVVRAVVSRAAGANVDVVAPAGARYVRPYVQTYGTLVQNDVEVIDWADITDVVAFAPDVSALEGRIAAVESIDAGDRLDVVEAAIAAPDTVRFKTLGGLVAGSVPIIVDAIEVLGYAAPGDGGGHRRRRVAVASDATVVDADGYIWEIAEPTVTPEMLGGNVQASMLAAAAIGARWKAAPKIYTVSALTVPSDFDGEMGVALIAFTNSAGPADAYLSIGERVSFDRLNLTFDGSQQGTGTFPSLVKAGDDFACVSVGMSAPSAIGYDKNLNGLLTTGVRTRIRRMHTTNIDYPLSLINPSTTTLATGSQIGDIKADGYLRTLYAQFISADIGNITALRRSANASLISAPGRYITNLFEGVQDTTVGNLHLEECGHGVRIGGSPHANAKTQNITFGDIYVTKTRGCAFKVNPTLLLDASLPLTPYKTERAFGITTGNIVGVDVGDGTSEGNREFIRLTRADKVSLGHCRAFIRDATFSGQAGISLCNVTGVKLASLYGDGFATPFVSIDSQQESDGITLASGPVYGVDIPIVSGKSNSSSFLVIQSAPFYTMEYGDLNFGMAGAIFGTSSSANTRVFNTFTGGGGTPILVTGRRVDITGTPNTVYLPQFLNLPSNAGPDNFNVDLRWNGRRFSGVPNNPRFLAGHAVQAGGFEAGTPGNQIADGMFSTYYAVQVGTGAGDLVPGGTFAASRPNSSRRGAVFGAIQVGASPTSVGAGIWTGLGAVGEDQVQLGAIMRPDGFFELRNGNSNGCIFLSETGVRKKITVTDANTIVVANA
ncbi:hypothetical protein [Bosea sp. NPDC055594]